MNYMSCNYKHMGTYLKYDISPLIFAEPDNNFNGRACPNLCSDSLFCPKASC